MKVKFTFKNSGPLEEYLIPFSLACCVLEIKKILAEFCSENLNQRDHFQDLRADGSLTSDRF
jgi:hypothetical protein